MSEFYLIKTPDEAKIRKIHRAECTELPPAPYANPGVYYLGSYSNKQAAYNLANGRFEGADYCPQCLKQ